MIVRNSLNRILTYLINNFNMYLYYSRKILLTIDLLSLKNVWYNALYLLPK